LNFLAAVFVFPESLSREKRRKAMEEWENAKVKGKGNGNVETEEGRRVQEEEGQEGVGVMARLFSPLAIFLPVMVRDPNGNGRMRRDWSLTMLAISYCCLMLCVVSFIPLRERRCFFKKMMI
jgi:hypothetical protein